MVYQTKGKEVNPILLKSLKKKKVCIECLDRIPTDLLKEYLKEREYLDDRAFRKKEYRLLKKTKKEMDSYVQSKGGDAYIQAVAQQFDSTIPMVALRASGMTPPGQPFIMTTTDSQSKT